MASDLHPYLMYRIGPSKEHRKEHLEWDGLILPKDDPFWDSHLPPNGWGCKCHTRAVTEAQKQRYEKEGIPVPKSVDGRGGGILRVKTEAPPVKYKTFINERKGIAERVPEGIDPSFNWNVGKDGRQKEVEALREKIENTTKMLIGDTANFENIPLPLNPKEIDEFQQVSDKVYSIMSSKEKLYVGKYTIGYAQRINDYLANNGKGYIKGSFKKHIENIDKAINRFVLSRNIVVYRGTDASYYAKHEVGKVFTEKLYYSSSFEKEPAQKMLRFNPNPIMLEIRVPKGAKGLYIGAKTEYNENQMEFLLKRGTKYLLIYKDSTKVILEVVK
jgi:hypothetical protein